MKESSNENQPRDGDDVNSEEEEKQTEEGSRSPQVDSTDEGWSLRYSESELDSSDDDRPQSSASTASTGRENNWIPPANNFVANIFISCFIYFVSDSFMKRIGLESDSDDGEICEEVDDHWMAEYLLSLPIAPESTSDLPGGSGNGSTVVVQEASDQYDVFDDM